MPLSDFTKQQQLEIKYDLLERMLNTPLSIADAAAILFPKETPGYAAARAETILDELWEQGYCYCGGKFLNFDYYITYQGKEFVHRTPNPTRGIEL